MATYSICKPSATRDISKRNVYRLLGWSSVFPPVFAAAPFFVFVFIGFLALGFAYMYLATYVLPLAYAGLGLGYYLGKKLSPSKKLLIAAMGYLAGFDAGLQVIAWLVFPITPGFSGISTYLVGLAMAGLVVAFCFSKIGAKQESDPDFMSAVQPLDVIAQHVQLNSHTENLRIGVVIVLGIASAITFVMPFLFSR